MNAKVALPVASAALALSLLSPARIWAEDDPIETAGVAVGVTAGNAVVIPAKIISVGTGFIAGALSFILTGGNAELTLQIWRDVTEGPYYVSPALARRAIGERPELEKRKAGTVDATPAPVVTNPAPAEATVPPADSRQP
jgi:hypothetical protein